MKGADVVTSAEQLPLVLDLRDLARLLRCSRRTVERLQRAGQLPEPLLNHGHPRWARDEMIAWVSGGARRQRGRA